MRRTIALIITLFVLVVVLISGLMLVPVKADTPSRIVYIVKYIDKPVTPKQFESVEQAENWLAEHHLPVTLISRDNGLINLDRYTFDARADCDDYSQDYQQLALNDGFLLTEVPVYNGRIWDVKVTNAPGLHVGTWTKIDNVYYYVESSPVAKGAYKLIKIKKAD